MAAEDIIDSSITFGSSDYEPDTAYPALYGSTTAELAAGAAIRNYCGWHVAPAVTEVLTVDGSGHSVQQLPTLHLNSVASVSDADVALASGDYEWSQAGYLRKGCWTSRLRGVSATVNHGFAAAPPEIAALITRLAALGIAGRSGTVRVGEVSVSATADQVAGVLGLDEHSVRVLSRYRIPGF